MTPFVAVVVVALLLAAGLVHDGGQILAGRREVANGARAAARIGAQAVSEQSARAGLAAFAVDEVAARDAARAHLTRRGLTGRVTVEGDTVVVEVWATVDLTVLALGGLTSRTVRARERAEAVPGVTEPLR